MTGRPAAMAAPFATGAATALALGVYAAAHEPTARDFVLFGFTSAGAWKSALASIAMFLFVVQVSLGLRITGRIGPRLPPPRWAPELHRLIGTVAFGISLPVVFHCVWTLGYRADDSRLVVHSIFGCVAYGLYVTKIIAVRRDDATWAVPLTGALLGSAMLVAWWTSAFVFYAGSGS